MNRSSLSRESIDPSIRDKAVIDRLNEVVSRHSQWGFWKCFHWMRQRGEEFNHKKVWRVYKSLGLNLPRRTKKRIPKRERQPLEVPNEANCMWSMDFMSDSLYHGKRFRTLNVIDEGVREALAIEVDSTLPTDRVIRVLEQIEESRSLPKQIRVDNGPEFISAKLVAWCESRDIRLHHIQPGKPTQNAYIERFNKSMRREVLDAHLFGSLTEVRDIVHQWMIDYNEERPHESLNNLPPSVYRRSLNKTNNQETLVLN